MSSLNTNVAAMTALQSLTETNQALTEAQKRISTGLRVANASDNAAYWSIATTMRSDNSALSTVQDALGLGASTIDVAYTAVDASIDIVKQIKDKLVAAAQPGLDRAKIQTEITELQAQLVGISGSATLQGQNWLSIDSSAAGFNITKSIVSSISRAGGTITVQTIDINTTSMVLFDANVAAEGVPDGLRDPTTGALAADQAVWIAVGGVAFVATLMLLPDHRVLERYTYLIGLLGVGLLVATMIFGTRIYGAKLWIEIGGGQTVQLGEVSKILIVIFLAAYLRDKRELLAIPTGRFMGVPVPPMAAPARRNSGLLATLKRTSRPAAASASSITLRTR